MLAWPEGPHRGAWNGGRSHSWCVSSGGRQSQELAEQWVIKPLRTQELRSNCGITRQGAAKLRLMIGQMSIIAE